MDDNRFAMMSVIRSVEASRRTHSDETVRTGLQGTRAAPPTRHADAQSRGVAGGSCTHVRGQSANGVDLGAGTAGRSAGLASKAAGSTRVDGRHAKAQALQDAGDWCNRQWLSDRTVDARAHWQTDRARVRPFVQHRAYLAHRARVGFQQPASDGSRDPARRGSDSRMENQTLACAKKSPDEREEPSSSSTNLD